GRMFYDKVVEMPKVSGLENAHRSFEVKVVNLRTMQVNASKCNQSVESATLDEGEFYMGITTLTWGKERKEQIKMSVVLPSNEAPALTSLLPPSRTARAEFVFEER